MSASTLAIAMLLNGAPADQPAGTLPATSAPTSVSDAPALAPSQTVPPAQLAPPPAPPPTTPEATSPSATPFPATVATVTTPVPLPLDKPPPLADADKGDIVVTARPKSVPGDPAQAINLESFKAVQMVDKAIIGPIAHGYTKVVPKPVRSGIHNVLNNLDEPIVFLNFVLQLKPGKALETLGRFTINSTIGAAGLFDVAKKKPFNLPRRSNGLADTLGYYGIGPGPYLFLPLIGSTTVRDMLGRVVDLAVVPTAFGKPFNRPEYSLTAGILRSLDERAQYDDTLTRLRETADPYSAIRAYYLQKRRDEIDVLKGKRKSEPVPAAPVSAAPSTPPPVVPTLTPSPTPAP
ncbi:MAG: VacJ family lipoprotein [Sphingobium sp.]